MKNFTISSLLLFFAVVAFFSFVDAYPKSNFSAIDVWVRVLGIGFSILLICIATIQPWRKNSSWF